MTTDNLYRTFKNVKHAIRLGKRKPGLIWKLIKLQVNRLMGNPPLFRIIEIATSYDCNLKCTHCSADTLRESKSESLTLEDYARLGRSVRNIMFQ